METVKLGKKGQISIPKGILKRLGLEGDVTLLIDTTTECAIVLRPAAVYPIEIYTLSAFGSSTRQTAWMRRQQRGSRRYSRASEEILSRCQRHLHAIIIGLFFGWFSWRG
jgi:AbrB family looped-hinge helix DNA binding protein